MTKIVFRFIPSGLDGMPLSAKPKTLYLAGDRWARIEQRVGLSNGEPNLIVINEPNIWTVDQLTQYGTHSVNPGPDLVVHTPILESNAPEALSAFEFGHELEFLNRIDARAIGQKNIFGTQCETRHFEVEGYLILVDVDIKKSTPVELRVFTEGHLRFSVQYSTYETGLPFEPALFVPPKHIKFLEVLK